MAVSIVDSDLSSFDTAITMTAAGEGDMLCLVGITASRTQAAGGITIGAPTFDGENMELVKTVNGEDALSDYYYRTQIWKYVVGTYSGDKTVAFGASLATGKWNSAILISAADKLETIIETESASTKTETSIVLTFSIADVNGLIYVVKVGEIYDDIDEAGFTNVVTRISHEHDYKISPDIDQSITYFTDGDPKGRCAVACAVQEGVSEIMRSVFIM